MDHRIARAEAAYAAADAAEKAAAEARDAGPRGDAELKAAYDAARDAWELALYEVTKARDRARWDAWLRGDTWELALYEVTKARDRARWDAWLRGDTAIPCSRAARGVQGAGPPADGYEDGPEGRPQ